MSTRRERVLAFKAAHDLIGAAAGPMPHTTDDALALAEELSPSELTHADKVVERTAVMKDLMATPEPEAFDDKLAYYQARKESTEHFWDAFEGQEVSGVTIIRRR